MSAATIGHCCWGLHLGLVWAIVSSLQSSAGISVVESAGQHKLESGDDGLNRHKAAYRVAFLSFVKNMRHFSPKFLALYHIVQTVSTRHVALYESPQSVHLSTVSTDNGHHDRLSSSSAVVAASVPINTLSKHLSPIDLISEAWPDSPAPPLVRDRGISDVGRKNLVRLISDLFGQPLESPSVKEALYKALNAKLKSLLTANAQGDSVSSALGLVYRYITDVHLKWLIKTAGLWPVLTSSLQLMSQVQPPPVQVLGRSSSIWDAMSGIACTFLQTLGTSYEEYSGPQPTLTEARLKLQNVMQLSLGDYLPSHRVNPTSSTSASAQPKNGSSVSNAIKEPTPSLSEIAMLWDILSLYTHTEYDSVTGSWRSGDGGLGRATVGYLNEKMDVARAALQSLQSFLKGLPSLVIRPTAMSQSDAADDGERRYMSLLLQYCSVPPALANEVSILVDHLTLDIIPAVEPYLTGLSTTAATTEYDTSNSPSQPQLLPADTVKLIDTLYHRLVRTRNELTCVLGTVIIERVIICIIVYTQRCILMMYKDSVDSTEVHLDARSYASSVHLCSRYVSIYAHSTYFMV